MFGPDGPGGRRGQTTVGTVLVIGFVLAGTVGIVALGATAISDIQQSAETERAVQSLSQFDSQAAQVALGDSTAQTIEMPSEGNAYIEEDSGSITVELVDKPGGNDTTLVDESLGAVVYRGEVTVAYQGGGVWRHRGNSTSMVSPPEFHYRQQDGRTPTLTFPVVTVNGDGEVRRGLEITQTAGVSERFPSGSASNPLDEGNVEVTIESEYAGGWATYFEERTSAASVDYDGDDTVVATLVTPVPERVVEDAIVSDAPNPAIVGSGEVNSFNSTSGAPSTTTGNGTVYVGEDYTSTGSGDVYGDLFVDGNYTAGGSARIEGDVVVTGNVDLSGNPTITGDLLVGGDITVSGGDVDGDIYAWGDVYHDSYPGLPNDVYVDGTYYGDGGGPIDGTVHTGGDLYLGNNQRLDGTARVAGTYHGPDPDNPPPSEAWRINGDVEKDASQPDLSPADRAQTLESPNLQPIDAEVESRVDTLRNASDNAAASDYDAIADIVGNCQPECMLSNGSYYFDELTLGGSETLTLDTTDGPILLGVDGDIDFDGGGNVNIVGDGRVNVYYTGDFETNIDVENANDHGDQLWLHGTSTSTAEVTGNADFYGVVYAPSNQDIEAIGSGSIYGGVVGNVSDTGGNVDIYYDEALRDSTPALDSAVGTPITYLHVSVTGIRVEPMDG
jgi:hypothetical protein